MKWNLLPRRFFGAAATAVVALLLLQGCGTLRLATPLPRDLEDQAQVRGFPGVRAWGDS